MSQLDLLSFTPPEPPTPTGPSPIFPHQIRVPVDTSERRDNADRLFKVIQRMYRETHQDGTFHTFLDIVLAVLNRFHAGEGPYMEAIKGLPREAVEDAAHGFGILKQHFWVEGCFYDILGDVYMQIRSDWAGKAMGQYFTPWHVCVMMAQMSIEADDILEKVESQGAIDLYEPTVGSGATLLAMKAVICELFKHEDDPRRHLRYVKCSGQDVDQICVKMAKIQLMMSDDRWMTNFMLASYSELATNSEMSDE